MALRELAKRFPPESSPARGSFELLGIDEMGGESDRANGVISEWDWPPTDISEPVFPPNAICIMSDEQVVSVEGLRRDLATAVAQAGKECEAKHVALNEIKLLRAQLAGATNTNARWMAATGCLTPEEFSRQFSFGE